MQQFIHVINESIQKGENKQKTSYIFSKYKEKIRKNNYKFGYCYISASI